MVPFRFALTERDGTGSFDGNVEHNLHHIEVVDAIRELLARIEVLEAK